MTTVNDLKGQTVAFAASGGLDSCTVTQWLTENGVEVVCFTADIAQPDETDFGEIEKRMRACGAADYVAIPLHDMIADSGLEVIQFQAKYEGNYWNTTGIGRHVIVAGKNYGQGSSREHAALAPRYLGLRLVLAIQFARIHHENLVNFGVLPLTFADPEDHEADDQQAEEDESDPGFREVANGGEH